MKLALALLLGIALTGCDWLLEKDDLVDLSGRKLLYDKPVGSLALHPDQRPAGLAGSTSGSRSRDAMTMHGQTQGATF